tara:strand:- start:48 stop:728 length:681 start_codon:yes stop_codon:yes gene_type:complete
LIINKAELIKKIPFLFYFSHIDNAIDILNYGLFSRNQAEHELLIQKDFSNKYVQSRRNKIIELSNSKELELHNLVNLYFNPINPTLAVTQRNYGHEDIVIYCIDFNKIISDKKIGIAFTDRNAAVNEDNLNIYNNLNSIDQLNFDIIHGSYLKDRNDSTYTNWKQIRSAEFFVYPSVSPDYINNVLTTSNETKNYLEEEINSYQLKLQSFNGIQVDKNLDMYSFYS